MTAELTVIIAPPPTPNGDLHVGHLSGPYLGADVLRRYLTLQGRDAVAALSVDLNQSYVVTTAERLGTEPLALARKSHADIQTTLSKSQIHFDVVAIPDTAYTQSVSDWFKHLFDTGVIEKHRRLSPFDIKRNRFMFESYATGYCPTCLSGTKANICEACGHPNEASDLLGLYPTGGEAGDPVEMREIDEYFIDLEKWREPLLDHLRHHIPEKRPNLSRLIDELFAKRLAKFPITFPSRWGIPAPFPNADGLVLNVWAEMLPGHFHWIDQACMLRGFEGATARASSVRYVQYLGFDNSFFYVIAHLGLALAARAGGLKHILPTAFITNEFYLLDNFKFSTSQGHLIWGRDLLAETPADDVRFYLAWSNPEYNQANFTREDMERVLDKKFRQPIKRVCELFGGKSGPVSGSAYAASLLARFETAYDYRHQSLRMAALTVANGLELIESLAKHGTNTDVLRSIVKATACGLAPLASDAALKLWRSIGLDGPIFWPEGKDLLPSEPAFNGSGFQEEASEPGSKLQLLGAVVT
ncbi:class I tRNA ligase family protein [Agrobacterium vitis]|uniref:Class I tRNA ligase family protein n=1 Tax=Agrobacterium vitis TaxID=373 RepID=A0AAE4WEG5_AGRVI|nr:class I tRNA ligase family protein [Agrobacterium vitis]MCF1500015.1 class I tRNA ligase family protein [Allorhizobium sp. Av2]MCM2442300.1 class I tRNA ligase family protein [Agrobacterium vitis]MUZ58710.1 class I tRNA ligase family protein [Agrobacterium vitis]MVA66345.1 class I tRNA ligase family protein [Agrobacterium vitis]MVA88382.1 class I tRNA ligase family protein [Agrobacterium vitis]